MQFSLLGPAALLAAVASATCTNDDNNYYCDQVEAITYEGIGGSGSYNKITSMDATADSCGSTPLGYSGIMSPLDEEVSAIARSLKPAHELTGAFTGLLAFPRPSHTFAIRRVYTGRSIC